MFDLKTIQKYPNIAKHLLDIATRPNVFFTKDEIRKAKNIQIIDIIEVGFSHFPIRKKGIEYSIRNRKFYMFEDCSSICNICHDNCYHELALAFLFKDNHKGEK